MFPSSTPRTMAKYQDSNLLTGDGAKIWYFFFFIIVFSLKLNIELLQRDLRQFDYGELNGNPNFIFAIRNCTAGAEQKLQFRLRKARLGQLFLSTRFTQFKFNSPVVDSTNFTVTMDLVFVKDLNLCSKSRKTGARRLSGAWGLEGLFGD
ncbi:hypothetical protein C5167_042240 [Papaver somniferum]|uniref:Uncharacterized protein n=1 Tax=Papaver somniferum TaxID=3469 RepID=A0A4Y7L285_PAPSO|nr:hypothetical protein C5167_042240 [Papaver somniferum]